MVLGELGMIQQAGDEIRRPAAEADSVSRHQVQDQAWIPRVAQMDRHTFEHRAKQPTEHADEMPYRQSRQVSGGMLRMTGVELTDLAAQGLMAVHDALGIAGGSRREGDQRRFRRVGVDRARHGFVGKQFIEIPANQCRQSARRRTGQPETACARTARL